MGKKGLLIAGTVMGGLFSAASGAISGATGASILATEYDGYSVSEATQMGAIGGGIFGIPAGLFITCPQLWK